MNYSTSNNLHGNNVDAWRAAIARAFGPLDVHPTSDDRFGGHVRFSRRGQIQFTDVCYVGQKAERTSANLSFAKNEIFVLTRPVQSPLYWKTDWGQGALRRGQWHLIYHSRPVEFDFEPNEAYRGFSVAVPAAALRLREPKLSELYSIPYVDPRSSRAQLLESYIDHVKAGLGTWSDAQFTELCERLYDLVTLLVVHGNQPTISTQESSIKTAHRERAIAYIKAQLGDCELSVEKVARYCNISPSYLRQVFALGGLTVESFIYSQRIEKSRQFLADPNREQKSISQIAYQVGFRNISHFNRLFKQRFGVSPKHYRVEGSVSEVDPLHGPIIVPRSTRNSGDFDQKAQSFEFELAPRIIPLPGTR